MITLKELEQFQRQQANAALAEDVDAAGARYRYVRELQWLQEQLRQSGWVGAHGIPEAFPGTNVSATRSGARARKPSEKILPTPEQVIERFRWWGRRANIGSQIAQHVERLEAQFQQQVAAMQELPPRAELDPGSCRQRVARIIQQERERRGLRGVELAARAGIHYKAVAKIERAGADSQLGTIAKVVTRGFGIYPLNPGMLRVAGAFLERDMLSTTSAAVRYYVRQLNGQAVTETGEPEALYPAGLYLKQIREARGLSGRHIADHSGLPVMHDTYIRKYEAGLVPQFSHFMGWVNGLRLSDHDAAVAWTLYMQQPYPVTAGSGSAEMVDDPGVAAED